MAAAAVADTWGNQKTVVSQSVSQSFLLCTSFCSVLSNSVSCERITTTTTVDNHCLVCQRASECRVESSAIGPAIISGSETFLSISRSLSLSPFISSFLNPSKWVSFSVCCNCTAAAATVAVPVCVPSNVAAFTAFTAFAFCQCHHHHHRQRQ